MKCTSTKVQQIVSVCTSQDVELLCIQTPRYQDASETYHVTKGQKSHHYTQYDSQGVQLNALQWQTDNYVPKHHPPGAAGQCPVIVLIRRSYVETCCWQVVGFVEVVAAWYWWKWQSNQVALAQVGPSVVVPSSAVSVERTQAANATVHVVVLVQTDEEQSYPRTEKHNPGTQKDMLYDLCD